MIINQLTFCRIQVQPLTQKLLQVLGASQDEDLQLQIEFQIGHSFDSTQKKIMRRSEQQQGSIFLKQIHLFCSNEEDILKLQLLCFTKQQFKSFKQYVSFKKILQNPDEFVDFAVGQQQQKIKLSYKLTHHQQNVSKRLKIISPKFQFMKTAIQKDSFLLQMNYLNNIQRTMTYTNTLFWQDSLQFVLNESQNKAFIFLVNSIKNKTKVYQLNIQIFKKKAGSKKIILFNNNNFPMGCFQFDYQTQGFPDIQKEVIPKHYTSEIYQIQIGKVKGKFKSPTSQVCSIKIVANISNIEIEKIPLTGDSFQYDLGKYIYSEESSCMFIVTFFQNNVEVVGYAPLDLMMLGKFQKRISINHFQTKTIMGHLYISIQAMKKAAKKLRLSAIWLKVQNFEQKQKQIQVMLNASISCCFGKTQIRQLSSLVNFVKGLQVKYSKAQILQLNLIETITNSKIQIPVRLLQLQAKISGKYEQNFGTQVDFVRGTISFEYSYDEYRKPSLDQRQKILDQPDMNKKQEIPTNIISQQKQINLKSLQIHIENQNERMQEVEQEVKIIDKQQTNRIQLKQQVKPVTTQESNIQIIKITPKQAILQTSFTSYKLENHLIQYISTHKKMKSHKKKPVLSPSAKIDSKFASQAQITKKSRNKTNKIEPLKRYEYVKNIYFGMKNFSSSNTSPLHKKSYSNKLNQISCKKQIKLQKQPQLPKIGGQKTKLNQKKIFALGTDHIARISVNRFRKN